LVALRQAPTILWHTSPPCTPTPPCITEGTLAGTRKGRKVPVSPTTKSGFQPGNGKKETEKKSGIVKRMRHSKIDEKKVAKIVLTLY
jgi:hypothetical protein